MSPHFLSIISPIHLIRRHSCLPFSLHIPPENAILVVLRASTCVWRASPRTHNPHFITASIVRPNILLYYLQHYISTSLWSPISPGTTVSIFLSLHPSFRCFMAVLLAVHYIKNQKKTGWSVSTEHSAFIYFCSLAVIRSLHNLAYIFQFRFGNQWRASAII